MSTEHYLNRRQTRRPTGSSHFFNDKKPRGFSIWHASVATYGGFGLPVIWVLLVLTFSDASTQAQVSGEYRQKAVFLYDFAQFTQWPDDAFADAKAPLVIGVLGHNPFGPVLDDTIRGETAQGRTLVVEHYRRGDEIKTCHILFISQSETRRMDEIVKSLRGKPVLTVADANGPQATGVVIRFLVENNKVHFRINQEAAQAANLTLSSKLLRVADAEPQEKSP